MGFALHPEAILDLDDIHQHINRFNFNSANRMLHEVIHTFESLSLLPHQRAPATRYYVTSPTIQSDPKLSDRLRSG